MPRLTKTRLAFVVVGGGEGDKKEEDGRIKRRSKGSEKKARIRS